MGENRLPRLDGEEREFTALFSDIRGFSSFSETFQDNPRELVRVLNQYLTRVSTALLREGGCLDKYIGDAVVCLFGAPVDHSDHAVRACRGALAAQAEVARLRFAEAAGVLKAQLSEDPEDGPTAALLARCQKYEQHPPAHFDGVTNLEK